MLLDVGESHVELLAPLGDDTPVGRFLAKRGPGLHHVAYQVDDIEATLRRCARPGLRLIDETPRTGIRGSRVAFLHPAATAPCSPSSSSRLRFTHEHGETSRGRLPGRQVLSLRIAEDSSASCARPWRRAGERLARGRGRRRRRRSTSAQVVYLRVESDEHRVGF